MLGRNAYIDVALRGIGVTVYKTLHGLAVTIDGESWYLLREYRTFRQRYWLSREEFPFCFYFERCNEGHCPRIAVAYQQ